MKATGLVSNRALIIFEAVLSQKAHSHGETIVSHGFDKLIEHGDLHGSIKEVKNHRRKQHLSKSTADSKELQITINEISFNDLVNEVKPAAIASLGKKKVPHFSKEIGFGPLLDQDDEENFIGS